MATTEKSFPALPADLAGRLRDILGRSPFYVNGATYLRVQETSNIAQVPLVIGWRLGLPSGDIIVNQTTLQTVGDRVPHFIDIYLGEGLLFNVTIGAQFGQIATNSIFVQAFLTNGEGTVATKIGSLVANYITGSQTLGWPGTPIITSTEGPGRTISQSGGGVAAGGQLNFTIPSNTRWLLQSISARFTASAAAGARTLYYRFIAQSGVPMFYCSPGVTVAPGFAPVLMAASGGSRSVSVAGDLLLEALPTPFYLQRGSTIQTLVTGMDVADQWSEVQFQVQEWLEVN